MGPPGRKCRDGADHGALHEGHLSLVRAALEKADRVIVTLFVNPKQFNNAADIATYPRTEDEDAAKLVPQGAHLLYVPDAGATYPEAFATFRCPVSATACAAPSGGAISMAWRPSSPSSACRPALTSASLARRTFNSFSLVRRMVRDLGIPITIVPCPTVREADGLALSSHYVRLSPVERAVVPKLPTVLLETAEGLARGSPVLPTLAEAREAILAAGYREDEYLELRDEADLRPTTILDRPARLVVATWDRQFPVRARPVEEDRAHPFAIRCVRDPT